MSVVGGYTLLSFSVASELLKQILPSGVTIIYTSPTDYVYTKTMVALLISLVLSLPIIIYHGNRFLRPSTSVKWDKVIAPSILFSVGFFFGVHYITPILLSTLLSTEVATPMLELDNILDFTLGIGVVFGLTFLLPYIIHKLGICRSTLSGYRQHIYLSTFILTGILTADPTPISQMALAVPFILSYEVSRVVAK